MSYLLLDINYVIDISDFIKLQIYDNTKPNYYDIVNNYAYNVLLPETLKSKITQDYGIKKFLFPNKADTDYINIYTLTKLLLKDTGYKLIDIMQKVKKPGLKHFIYKPWSECRLMTWKDGTYNIYTAIIKKFAQLMNYDIEFYYQEMLITGHEYILKWTNSNNMAPASNELYLKAILVYLEHFSNDIPMTIFATYAKEKNKYADIEKSIIEVPRYDLLYNKFISCINDSSIPELYKTIITIFKEVGILRYSDLRYTQLKESYDNKCPYSQLCPGIYYIKKEYTKNGKDRTFTIKEGIYEDILLLRNIQSPWLLLNPPELINLNTIAHEIKRLVGYNLNIMRGSLETYAIKNYSKKLSEEISYLMGHTFKTVIKYYYRE